MTFSNWKQCKLGDFLTFQRGFDITKRQQVPGPYPVISSSGVKSTHNTLKVKGPGVVIGRKGSLGTVYFSRGDFWPHDTTLWVKDFHGNDAKFAYYFLQTLHLERYDVGASNPTLNRNHIHLLPVAVPPLDIQRKIASTLSSYDDLVENNTQRIAILEEMAQILFLEWFMHFRFPGHENAKFIESKSAKVPDGWEIKTLNDIAIRKKIKYVDEKHQHLPLLNLARIPRRTNAVNDFGESDEIKTSRIIFEKGDILFGSIRPYFHKVIYSPVKGVTNISVFVLKARSTIPSSFLFSLLFSDQTVSWTNQYSTGTKMPVIKWEVMKNMKITLPPSNLLTIFDKIVNPMLGAISSFIEENQVLRKSRDLLLPRLISGEIDVSKLNTNSPGD